MAGFIASITARTSFLGVPTALAKDAQAGVLFAGPAAAAGEQPSEDTDQQQSERRE
jgi:hypothetical protein